MADNLEANTPVAELVVRILNEIDAIILSCEENNRPLELDPARSELFELFVLAEGAGCLKEDSNPDLTADGICRMLAERWGLKDAAQESVKNETSIPMNHMAKMRSLWSVMRMWMEWTYAWERWSEFHGEKD